MRKDFTAVFQKVSVKWMFLVRFQYGCEKYLTSNQLTAVTVEKSPVNEEVNGAHNYQFRSEIL